MTPSKAEAIAVCIAWGLSVFFVLGIVWHAIDRIIG